MNRAFLSFALFVVTGSWVALAAPVPQEAAKPRPFHPTTKGTEWVYECGGRTATQTITKAEKTDAGVVIVMCLLAKDGDPQESVWRVSDKALSQLAQRRDEFDRPVEFVKLPAKEGDSWAVEQTVDQVVQYSGKVTVGKVEVVEVPAGKFDCVRIDWDYKIGERAVKRTYWYAPGVGLVKIKGNPCDLLLKEFKPAKD